MTFHIHFFMTMQIKCGFYLFFCLHSKLSRSIYLLDWLLTSSVCAIHFSLFFFQLSCLFPVSSYISLQYTFDPFSFLLSAHFPTHCFTILHFIHLFPQLFLASVRHRAPYFTAFPRIPVFFVFSLHFLIRNSRVCLLASTLLVVSPLGNTFPCRPPHIFSSWYSSVFLSLSSSALLCVRARTSSFHRAESILWKVTQHTYVHISALVHVYSSRVTNYYRRFIIKL